VLSLPACLPQGQCCGGQESVTKGLWGAPRRIGACQLRGMGPRIILQEALNARVFSRGGSFRGNGGCAGLRDRRAPQTAPLIIVAGASPALTVGKPAC
jgi:hypothetical protein